MGYKEIRCHMIFDIKMDFTRKARYVAGGHLADAPSSQTYASVVSRDSVRIALMIAALNELDVFSADIQNAYLNAKSREKLWCRAGKEFGPNEGCVVVIVRALYGMKSSGAAWRAHLAQTMKDLGFDPSKADPDVWMRPATKPDGFQYYEYVLIHTDDLLVVSHRADVIMKSFTDFYTLKEDPATQLPYGPPTRYLGADVGQFEVNGIKAWYLSGDSYCKEAVKTVELKLAESGQLLAKGVTSPVSTGYRPELDISPVLDDEQANYYQNLIGVLRWSVELGRIDIHVEVALMSRYLAQPRKGHLEETLRIFAFLKHHPRSKVVLDPTDVDFGVDRFQTVDWSDFYDNPKEEIPPGMPEPRGNPVTITAFEDANHAGDKVTRRSHTGILIYLNCAPIIWYSKAQNTVESSTFGSEFVALRTCAELLKSMRYKVRMMGIPLDGPANVFCDNEAVVKNTSIPESTIKKKHLSICYHVVREAAAANILRVAHEPSVTNLADVLTKIMGGTKKRELIQRILY